ncbi:DUF4287 domain-containing protein [Cryobacterium sp. BB736]|uniref:DUF4287 domain-containing protein n=1 Tax=Cryobacterium sp. BB736 TaxID=2746963 RepID=UPI0018741313|nr:DUF4287 domain-containing protein [Cryobacterium sp. BB736]
MSAVEGQNYSEEKVIASTGRTMDQWHQLLDGAGATGWKHPQIARWLVDEHGVDGWWAQGITVGFEQARGMRRPGQQADGTFAVSVSRTLGGAEYDAVVERLADSYGETMSRSPGARHPTARWRDGDESVLMTISPVKGGATRVTLTRSRIADDDGLAAAKADLAAALDRALK